MPGYDEAPGDRAMDDALVVLEDDTGTERATSSTAKIAIIDDDEAVHEGTRFALQDYALNGTGLDILSAYSAAQARDLLRLHPDTAVVLLDVVMETDTAGLELVGFIREDLGNETVRIILRTGQPGQAPEREVVLRYDINDYKAKTELTADKLFTTLTAALRSHEQLRRMSDTNRRLGVLVDATSTLLDVRSKRALAHSMLEALVAFAGVDDGAAGAVVITGKEIGHVAVLAGRGRLSGLSRNVDTTPPPRELLLALSAAEDGTPVFSQADDYLVIRLATESGRSVVVLLEDGARHLEPNRVLFNLFADRLAAAFDNVLLHDDLREANAHLEHRVAQRTRELLAANRRLEAQWARARRANAFQNEVLGIVAHDLKNPLSVIMGRTEILSDVLKDTDGLTDAARNQIGRIRESARRLTEMVEILIRDAMADAQDIPIQPEPTDLADLVREAVEANRPLADRKGQSLSFEGPAGIIVACDHERMREAVDNLVGNAVKYSPVGGVIAVTLAAGDGEARISVSDNGPGLMPEDYPRLFGRFQRLSARPTGGENATGLGLFIANRIVELHGGRIDVHSPGPNQGTVFEIVLATSGSAEAAA